MYSTGCSSYYNTRMSVFLLLLVIFCPSQTLADYYSGYNCNINLPTNNDEPKVIFVDRANDKNNSPCEWSENIFGYSIINNKTGSISVTLDFPSISCNFTNYTIGLYLVENEENNKAKHSEVHYKICEQNCDVNQTDKLTVRFDYVHSDCYVIKINNLTSPIKCFKTGYVFQLLSRDSFVIKKITQEVEKKLRFIVHLNESFFFNEPPEVLIKLLSIHQATNNETLFSKILLKFGQTNKNTCTSTINDSLCEYENNTTFNCSYNNIKPGGSYKWQIEFKERTRCSRSYNSYFCEEYGCCTFSNDLTFNEHTPNNSEEVSNYNSELNILLILLTVIIIIITIITFAYAILIRYKKYIRYRHILNRNLNDGLSNVSTEMQYYRDKLEILLLYARDNEAFMMMIESFKQLLNTSNNVKIYDIYEFDEEKNATPVRWLDQKLSDDRIITVLFLNECASFVYKLQKSNSLYKEPHCFDPLFLQALAFLSANQMKKTYKNFFITELSCVNYSDSSNFNSFNPYARYRMPQHENVVRLLNDMCLIKGTDIDKSSLNRFKQNCNNCVEYYKENTNYIYDILNINDSPNII